jgi:hypothetical protein
MTVEMQQISPKAKEICKQMLRAKTEGKQIYHTSARQKFITLQPGKNLSHFSQAKEDLYL